jgi:hypothetical protein
MKARALMIIMMGLLSACSGQPTADTYTDHAGKTTVIQTDREQCISSCNETYNVCMESFSSRNNGGVIGPSGMFGGGADCRKDLKDCLPQCQGR